MIESIVGIEKGRYPFDEEEAVEGQTVMVQDTQRFGSAGELAEKKKEMMVKNKVVESQHIIKLLKIYQEELALHFLYEHVPTSLPAYISQYSCNPHQQPPSTSSEFIFKKVTTELAMLVSYLIRMKIEVDLCTDTLGVSCDQKLKVFMNSRCRMGHKTELGLITFYSSRKEGITRFLEGKLSLLHKRQSPQNNFYIKGNRLVFSGSQLEDSGCLDEEAKPSPSSANSSLYDSGLLENPLKKSVNSCVNFKKARSSAFHARNTSHNLSSKLGARLAKEGLHPKFSLGKESKSDTVHKSSFQFGAHQPRNESSAGFCKQDNSDAKSFTHSKSVRIELEQNQDPHLKKSRKDSYKVKITTFHEYEMEDCDPRDLMGNMPNNQENLFNYFSKQSPPRQDRSRRNSQADEFVLENAASPTTPKSAFVRKGGKKDDGYQHSMATTARTLEDRVRMAKEKAESVLSRYMTTKKKPSSSRAGNVQSWMPQP